MRTSHLCLYLPLVIVVAFLCACACSRAPDRGYLELKRSQEAIREATSWQSDVLAQYPTGQPVIVQLSKVDCPGRMERVGILHELHNASVREIWLDGMYYNKTEGVAVWVSYPATNNPFPECGRGPFMIWDGVFYGDLDRVHATGEIRRGKQDNYDNAPYVWWEVAPAKGAKPHYSACIAESDHLPRLVSTLEHDLHYTYTLTRWNATVVTLPPEAKVITN
jgi:hypothetical protein